MLDVECDSTVCVCDRYPEYVLQHILELPSTEPGKSLKAAILLYSGFLIQLHNMNSRKVQRDGG